MSSVWLPSYHHHPFLIIVGQRGFWPANLYQVVVQRKTEINGRSETFEDVMNEKTEEHVVDSKKMSVVYLGVS